MEILALQKAPLEEPELMTREQCFKVFRVQQELQLHMMGDMMSQNYGNQLERTFINQAKA